MYQNIPTKVLTGEVRLSYAHLSEPYANPNQPGSEPKYSVTMLIPKTDVATKNKWGRIETYGGKLTENCVQAIARDCLAEAIERLEAAGFPIVFHVHDEVVIDIKPYAAHADMLDQVVQIMRQPPIWAIDLPLNADGWVGDFFTKD